MDPLDPTRTRWPDDRLDDKFDTIQSELRALRDVPKGMGEIAVEFKHLQEDTSACHEAIREMRADFVAYTEEQTQAYESHRLERKADRRWMIGTVLAAAGLVISAMAILVGHIG